MLTFYGANVFPPEEMPAERVKLLRLPFSEYEQSLREDLNRVLLSFAGQDTESSPSIESAIGSGLRTAEEALSQL